MAKAIRGVTGLMVGKTTAQRTTDSHSEIAHGSTVGASEGDIHLEIRISDG